MRKTLSEMDWFIVAATFSLVVVGILFIYSSGVTSEGVLVSGEYLKQAIWAVTGILLMLVFAVFDYQRLRDYTFVIYAVFIVILVYTRLFGRLVNGAKSWIGVGELGIQPSEFVKLVVILFLANYLESSRQSTGGLRRFLTAFGIVSIPMGLVLVQPDFGTALVFIPIFIVMAFVAGTDSKYVAFFVLSMLITSLLTVLPLYERIIARHRIPLLFVFYEKPYSYIVLGAAFAVFALALSGYRFFREKYYAGIAFASALMLISGFASMAAHAVLKEYQIMRLIVFLDPSVDKLGSGWNILQSITAIGSGGIFGKGYLHGTQSHYRYLPQQSTDFIFSIIAEEWGFIGSAFVFACFILILWRCFVIMRAVKDRYAAYIVAGIMGMLAFHFMINVGMTMGIMPITGIPLYFLSYGGSSLWSIMSAMGMVLGISTRRFRS
ncbi:MAG: rod shape-determining protein RodA [Spirochaetes bacterium]|nr:rod shape-determining protein RodA [Spirochaetota bacterium]